ncbi:MAG: NusG domain II-containing protein [Alkalispirochaeta sp.]
MSEPRRRVIIEFLKNLKLRPYDAVVFVVAVAVIVAFSVFAVGQGGPASTVEVKSDAGTFIYSLEEEQVLHFTGPLGDTVVEIGNGSVRFTESPCRDKICIAAGELTEAGQWAACLPNRVFISVTGEAAADGSGVDATAF